MKASTLRRILNLWPPFLFAGIRVAAFSDDFRHARVELRMRPWNRNYVGTHFGGSLFAMTDPFWMLLAMQAIGPDYVVWDKAGTIVFAMTDPFWMIMVKESLGRDYFVWDQAGEIAFLKPGRGTVSARFDLDPRIVQELRDAAAGGGKVLHWFQTDVLDAGGDTVARVRKQVYVRRKSR